MRCTFSAYFTNMKKTILGLLAILLCVASFSQNDNKILITPGIGVNDLKLGMSVKEALAVLEAEPSWYSFEQQLSDFTSDGSRIDSILQFVQGFDSCVRYSGSLPEKMPVFSLYFMDGKLNFITVTSYSATDEHLKAVEIKGGMRFHDNQGDCMEKLKKHPYVELAYGEYSGDHYYYTLGLEMIYDENKLTAIGIYPVTKDYKEKIAARSKELLELAGYGQ